jgi:predicted transcriptional regulator of viral defense system
MPGPKYNSIFEVAADCYGYVTVEQAKDVQVSPKTLHAMVRRGTLEHVSTGVYRVAAIPPSARAELMEASLWPRLALGVISHDSALVLHGLSDVNPAKIHITVPRKHRIVRTVPPLYVIHHAELGTSEVEYVDGIPATSPLRTIMDCSRAHLGPSLIKQAIDDGVRRGLFTAGQAERALSRSPECGETNG